MSENNGEWVILRNDEIIEKDTDLRRLLQKSEKYNPDEIIISKNPSSHYCFY